MKKVELLAPAGNLEKLKMAVIYGADAVYFAGQRFGLRAGAGNFSTGEIEEGVKFAHSHGSKAYLTVNIIPHNEHLKGLDEYIKDISELGVDALIVSDLGVFSIIRDILPGMEVHISTQANNVNYASAAFWHRLGAKRIILARELSLQEIKEIRASTPDSLDLEVFVHGAMCISYSGRCLLSNYMANRDSNLGDCAHPCRWKYHLVEEKRPGQYYPVFEDESGTFIFNSKDLCMIEHLPELIDSGVTSLKIEGRMKSAYYVATVVKAYRDALDTYYADPEEYRRSAAKWLDEVCKASHREFTTGFFFSKPGAEGQIYDRSTYVRDYDFVGLVLDYDPASGIATIEQRNRMFTGDIVEVVGPGRDYFVQSIEAMRNDEGEPIDVAPHPQQVVTMPMKHPVKPFDMLRKPQEE
ncbi:MAG: peptidase, U32 family large subunit [C1] [Firmicutes bacterium]|nr:peptidase, U32 family large subunit [C1] [Bacillota bacterium]MDI6706789.1 U32 family peptidase [Bacillota bacterium]